MNDDAQLIGETLRGNPAAFGQLVTRYQDRLYNTLVHVVGSTDLAHDAVQDALVQAYVKLETFEQNSSFYTWLYRIAVNLALSRHRKHRARGLGRIVRIGRNEPSVDVADESPENDPAYLVEQAEREAMVETALKTLAHEHRTIVILRDFDGRRYEEISELLRIPVGTVRSRLHRARSELRERLRSLIDEDAPAKPRCETLEKILDA